jgi:hypothetical protein
VGRVVQASPAVFRRVLRDNMESKWAVTVADGRPALASGGGESF